MENNKGISLIIARRIQLKFVPELIAYCFLVGIFIALAISCLSIILGLLGLAFGVWGFFYLKKIYVNNHSNKILITYKDDTFTILNELNPLHITKSKIIDLDYKIKKSFIYTPYIISQTEYNYGKLYIYFEDNDAQQKLTIYNVAEPDKVFDKMLDILGWNEITDKKFTD
ncbi:MAG: hypothetical protein MR862_04095 [Clostridia bacterium]|nr:hypothetical protein [Clostridia bacterium]